MKTSKGLFRFPGMFILISLLFIPFLYAQPQPGFSYQAVARDSDGSLISEASLTVRMQISAGSPEGEVIWQEDQDTETNQFGLFSLIVGGPNGYSRTGPISDIDWSGQQYYLTLLLKDGTQFLNMGSSPIQMVPVAQFASSAQNAAGSFSVQAKEIAVDGEALFEVRRSDGSVAFAVYEDMVWVFVDTSEAKGIKGGFAVGGYNSRKGPADEFLRVTPDSIRFYINTDPAKGLKGGFAVGGYNSARKAPTGEFLRITDDSIRMYVNTSPTKPKKGGFAVGGYNSAKFESDNFLLLTPENYFIGHNAGLNNTKGMFNSVLGYEAAMNNTEGKENVFMGYRAGYQNSLGLENIFIGKNAGYNNVGEIQTSPFYIAYGSVNVFIGTDAGYSNVSGYTNLFIGNRTGYDNTSGWDNTFVGNMAGQSNTEGTANTNIGTFSGRANQTGVQNVNVGYYAGNKNSNSENTFVGAYAGENNISGQLNTFIGAGSGRNSEGFGNIFIGWHAGFNETGSNKLYISNTETSTPLIKGDFSLSEVSLNGNVGVNGAAEPGKALYVHGDAVANTISEVSDLRLKTEIGTIENALAKVLGLRGVSFRWNEIALARGGFNESIQIGLIAQELKEVIPELVSENQDGTMSVSYSNLTAVLVEAVKEQQKELDEKDQQLRLLEERLTRLESILGEPE